MSLKYLIVEDSSKIREGVVEYFLKKSQGLIEFDQASTGTEGLRLATANEYNLIILDIMLPGMSGYDICKAIRKTKNCPIFFLTSLGGEDNILKGYELGGDDYIVKPFSVKELYAKTEVLLRRNKEESKSERRTIKNAEIELNPYTMQVFVSGSEVTLSPKEYFILKLLLENPEQVFSREAIINQVWEYDFDGTDRVVDSQIKKLRKNLGSSGNRIVTLFGRGYKIK